jgi:hypothetical protein
MKVLFTGADSFYWSGLLLLNQTFVTLAGDRALRAPIARFGRAELTAATQMPDYECADGLRSAGNAVMSASRLVARDTTGAMHALLATARLPRTALAHDAARQLAVLAHARGDTTQWLTALTLWRLQLGAVDSEFLAVDAELRAVHARYVVAHGNPPDVVPGRLADAPVPRTPQSFDAYLDRQWAALHERGFPVERSSRVASAGPHRLVVMEYLTAVMCGGCYYEDRAFQPLSRRYDPTDVLPLAYHYSPPIMDGTDSTDDRWYAWYPIHETASFRGQRAPRIPMQTKVAPDGDTLSNAFVNGHGLPPHHGAWPALQAPGERGYHTTVAVVDRELQRPPDARVQLQVVPEGDRLTVNVAVDSIRGRHQRLALRIAVVSDTVRVRTGTEKRIYQNVVRAEAQSDSLSMGVPIDARQPSHTTYSFDVAAIEAGVNCIHDADCVARAWGPDTAMAHDYERRHPDPRDWQIDRSQLRVVAFVQDLETSDVLQAAEVKAWPAGR